jgi:hypothetical protein
MKKLVRVFFVFLLYHVVADVHQNNVGLVVDDVNSLLDEVEQILHHGNAEEKTSKVVTEEQKTEVDGESDNQQQTEGVMDTIMKVDENLGYFEGDVIQQPPTHTNNNAFELRKDISYLWNTRIVPWEVVPANPWREGRIAKALKEISDRTCLQFPPLTKVKNTQNWIQFVSKRGCYSYVGKRWWRDGPQDISLGPGCYSKGIIQHEMLHALGVYHEQSRPDRDKYVEIMWENIEPGEINNFQLHSQFSTSSFGQLYDFDSIMHYGKFAFSRNKKPTILAKGNPSQKLGQRNVLSASDAIQLNLLYRCHENINGSNGRILTNWTDWTCGHLTSEGKCQLMRQRFCTEKDGSSCGDDYYEGVHTQFKDCPADSPCRSLDGQWGSWSSWSSCSKPCGFGKKRRTRKCDSPAPLNGADCLGDANGSAVCYIQSCSIDPSDCFFENVYADMCFWTVVTSTADYKFQRFSKRTPSAGTGPDGDYGTGTGHYVYAESSTPAKEGDKAELNSKLFPATKGLVMTFYYSMYGASMGSLEVFINKAKLWDMAGDQGKNWKKGEVIFNSDVPYTISFVATRGSSYTSDIALDAIQFKHVPSPSTTTPPPPPPPTTTTTTTTTTITTTTTTKSVLGDIEVLGCFHQEVLPFKTSVELFTDREANSPIKIKWKPQQESHNYFQSLLIRCRDQAKIRNMTHFSIRYYGLCQAGNATSNTLNSLKIPNYHHPDKCVTADGNYNKCRSPYDPTDTCIGTANHDFAYRLKYN